ncbi:hypothetical protein E3P77_00256 [Wallemia ichthyophaga]|uniref:Meiotic nuclear division protein 1-like protein n=1 Tax=Wallemia ichthyophaga (strain EXF-994 / CBS 113033) TaxID=1299270 RepID=R9AR38_WALI9|nr:Meiotic nuclear division protein 1-like protein [Wallemia ichthyophaga EXF-994]TIA72692.1 hypothetical protein E3P91_01902 [Wallemia ichthyophaga]EOR04682.1 Meiotic nuclear division protein 1-like protein [Wallemia ichthyophaga EXF-994]TIB02354.1 hypothetical protein E3P95_00982 [Wallemia ichthyophaga]TIB03194.1 hypothetical protein E3P94_01114 [Wallemia ichthyophaga]TIB63024.1 hypothetical protein E3P78_02012 [Wallemia ichthyophaga]
MALLPMAVELRRKHSNNASKQRLSHDEKKKRFLDYLHETRDFYQVGWILLHVLIDPTSTQLKELEKSVPKAKGIVAQSIKDILTELCNDSAVSQEKIGTSNYYWSFPSDAAKKAEDDQTTLTKQVAEGTAILNAAIATFDQLQEDGYEDTLERQELVSEYLRLTSVAKDREEELYRARKSGSAALDEKRKYNALAKAQVESYTDGTIAALSKMAQTFNMSESTLRESFQVNEEYEDVM